MVYRIHFETKGSYWCIQFRRFLRWTTALVENTEETTTSAKDATHKPLTFKTFNEAQLYVETNGIDLAYNRKATRTAYDAATSGVVNYPVPRGYMLVEVPDQSDGFNIPRGSRLVVASSSS